MKPSRMVESSGEVDRQAMDDEATQGEEFLNFESPRCDSPTNAGEDLVRQYEALGQIVTGHP